MELPSKLERWGPGPWVDEPDREEFEAHGLPCILRRHPYLGHWCGYAGVPPGHPLHGTHHGSVDVAAHGGVNYSEPCFQDVCHVPKPGESDDVWWFGFDCGHAWDLSPFMTKDFAPNLISKMCLEYCDIDYARAETVELARQLSEASQ